MKCTFDGCHRPYRSIGYCNPHYQQLRKYGSVSRLESDTPEHARFSSQIRVSSEGCWIWGNSTKNDYASFRSGGKVTPAHRYSYSKVVGDIPDGMFIDHICRHKGCVRPSHLRLATAKQNAENQSSRAGSITGVRGVTVDCGKFRVHVTHCGKGHYGGRFESLEEAAQAATRLRSKLFTHSNGE